MSIVVHYNSCTSEKLHVSVHVFERIQIAFVAHKRFPHEKGLNGNYTCTSPIDNNSRRISSKYIFHAVNYASLS